MRLFLANTLWKRQLRTLVQSAVTFAALTFIIGLLEIIRNLALGRSVAAEFFRVGTTVGTIILAIQIFISGLLLGAEEEENQTHSFVLRLPVSKVRWVAERLLGVVIGLIICLLLLLCDAIILGLYLKLPAFWHELWDSCIPPGFLATTVFESSNLALGFSFFWISACCAAWTKKVLPSAIISVGTIFLLLLVFGKLVMHTRFSILNPMQGVAIGFFIIAFVFIGFFFFAISRREGT